MVSYFGVYELLGQFVYRIYSNNIDFYHVKGDFTEVHFLWFFLGLCSSSSKNDHFRSNFKSTIGGSAKHQIEFQKKKYTYSRPRGDFGTVFSTQQLKLK